MNSVQRRIEVLFCDDIRTEASGKLLIVGTYFNDMVVGDFPIQLGQFAFYAKLITPLDRIFSSATVKLVFNDETLFESSVEAPSKETILANKRPDGVALVLPCVFQLQGVVLPKEGKLKVFCKFDDDDIEYSSLTLWVHKGVTAASS